MKKGKRFTISKVDNSDFSFNEFDFLDKKEPKNPFPGFNIPPVKYTGNQEHDAADELRYVHDSLLWVDKHPPQTDDVLDSPIFITVVFESRKQKIKFLKDIDIYKYGDKYFSYEIFVNAFGLDVENGTTSAITMPHQESKTSPFDFNSELDFSRFGNSEPQKKVVGKTLKNIRADEKRTAEYLAWAVDPSFWFCVCFRTQEQKMNFQKSLNVQSEPYAGFDLIWAHDFFRPFHVELEPCPFKPRVWSEKEDQRLIALLWNGETE